MRSTFPGFLAVVMLALVFALPAPAADNYAVDPIHSSVSFKIQHLGLTYVHGRFDNVAGSFTLDRDDPSKSSFTLTIKAESIDTNNAMRDTHLRGPDFFNVKEFPRLSFKSTAVKSVAGGLEVTGDMTLHGMTRPITFTLQGGKSAEFPKGVQRVGYTTDLVLKRSEFGMDKMLNAIGDEVYISIGMEGTRR
jgi:polyisoprenoid-binding protein YceI